MCFIGFKTITQNIAMDIQNIAKGVIMKKSRRLIEKYIQIYNIV